LTACARTQADWVEMVGRGNRTCTRCGKSEEVGSVKAARWPARQPGAGGWMIAESRRDDVCSSPL